MKKILIVDDIKGWRDYHCNIVNAILNYDCNIITAETAQDGYSKIMENNNEPFDIVITDLQMESDFEPKYAGEWLVEQIKIFPNYYKTKIVIISATYNINVIAENLGVFYIRKSTARNFPDSYKDIIV